MYAKNMRAATTSLVLVLPVILTLGACSNRESSPTSPSTPLLRITPADGATAVRLDAQVVLDFGTAVDRGAVENGLHLIAESDMNGSCPDSSMGPHGMMDPVMEDADMMRHMGSSHGTGGRFQWNSAGTVCTFVPDSLMQGQMRYMVHMSGDMMQMMERMGGTMMGGRMNGSGDMMVHFETMAADDHGGHH